MAEPHEEYKRSGATEDERVAAIEQIASQLDPTDAEHFELEATRLVELRDDTVKFAGAAVKRPGLDETTRFLIFTMGAIGCRRATDRLNATELFGGIGNQFDHIPLFQHLKALSLDEGSLDELKRGLRLERTALEAMGGNHPGASHAIASFTVQIAEQGDAETAGPKQLEEALNLAEDAIAKRPDYAKFYYTKGRILRRLGKLEEARNALHRAVELEHRDSASAGDRLRDYRLELRLVAVDQQSRAAAERVEDLDERVKQTTKRLESAQVGALAGVAFVASAVGLLQITAGSFGDRPFLEVIGIVTSFAVILFAAMAFGLRMVGQARRP